MEAPKELTTYPLGTFYREPIGTITARVVRMPPIRAGLFECIQ